MPGYLPATRRLHGWRDAKPSQAKSLPPGRFPPHLRRGFEILTYILEGSFRQEDSEGNSAGASAGGLMRTTAGRGVWHGEGASDGPSGPLHALQLWINPPRA